MSLVHYNTVDEIARFRDALGRHRRRRRRCEAVEQRRRYRVAQESSEQHVHAFRSISSAALSDLQTPVYVNSCSQGALSTDVEAAMHEYLASWHEHGSPWELWVEQVEALRTAFARSIGADRDEIAVMPSASAGINAVASALDFSGPRSTVVMGEFEFPTMAQVWLAQQRRGATIRWAKPTAIAWTSTHTPR